MIALIVILVIVTVLVAGTAALLGRRYRLRRRFGPEYDRVVAERHGMLHTEAELSGRQRRVRNLDIRPLSEESRLRYAADWTVIQERFVDAPQAAVMQAHSLLTTMMAERGYPDSDDERATADLSVDHAETVSHFRAAQQVTQQVTENGQFGDIDTEALRQALIHYRALFTDLLDGPVEVADQRAGEQPARDRQVAASRLTAGHHAAESSRP